MIPLARSMWPDPRAPWPDLELEMVETVENAVGEEGQHWASAPPVRCVRAIGEEG